VQTDGRTRLAESAQGIGFASIDRLRQDVATDEVRKASRSRVFDSPVPGEHTDVRTARPTKNIGCRASMKQSELSERFLRRRPMASIWIRRSMLSD
jgi:hypothetical protein